MPVQSALKVFELDSQMAPIESLFLIATLSQSSIFNKNIRWFGEFIFNLKTKLEKNIQ